MIAYLRVQLRIRMQENSDENREPESLAKRVDSGGARQGKTNGRR
jgi:hypothetical protein